MPRDTAEYDDVSVYSKTSLAFVASSLCCSKPLESLIGLILIVELSTKAEFEFELKIGSNPSGKLDTVYSALFELLLSFA